VLALQGKSLIGMVCAVALFALASPAGAATPLDNLPSATIATPASSLSAETQPYRPLFPVDDEDLAGFIAHATTNAVSVTEPSVWVKMLLGMAGLGFLLHRRVWWRKAAYISFDQRNQRNQQS
jgi:hypothetical protein